MYLTLYNIYNCSVELKCITGVVFSLWSARLKLARASRRELANHGVGTVGLWCWARELSMLQTCLRYVVYDIVICSLSL